MNEKPKLSLCVQYATEVQDVPSCEQFTLWFEEALQQDLNVSLRIVDEEEGLQLNSYYRKKDYATNVLTFVYDDEEPICGDVAICAPVVAREAAEQRKDLLAHYAHMSVHAALHLQGYDHEQDDEAEEMEALETQIMLKLNYPNPYQAES